MKNIENDVIKLAWENEQLKKENESLKEKIKQKDEQIKTVNQWAIQMREDLEDYKNSVDLLKKEQLIQQYKHYLISSCIEIDPEKATIKAIRKYCTPEEIAKIGALFDVNISE